jgi:branched-chain amino acid transport system permease protein
MSFQETFITINDCRVRIRRKGQGTPMIYLHGADGAAMIQPFMETLAQSYDLIVPEHPGFGSSDEPQWLDNIHDLAYYYLVLCFTLVMGLLLWGLLRSPWGKAFTALRDNPIRAESLGIDTRRYTLLSFAIGSVYAGLAGGLYASQVQFIDPALFTVGASIMMYLMVVVGGPGYFLGPVLGSAVGVILPEWLRFAQGWYLMVFGTAVVLLMIWLPDGLLSMPDRWRARRASRLASEQRRQAAHSGGVA